MVLCLHVFSVPTAFYILVCSTILRYYKNHVIIACLCFCYVPKLMCLINECEQLVYLCTVCGYFYMVLICIASWFWFIARDIFE